jgi:hypothetical protein
MQWWCQCGDRRVNGVSALLHEWLDFRASEGTAIVRREGARMFERQCSEWEVELGRIELCLSNVVDV